MKKRMILVVSLLMVFAFTAGVIANPAVESITANLAKDIKFVVDGESWAPAETDGSAMYPIIYKDRTYLPVRAIGEALGVKVDWNNDTRTVILGDAPAPVDPAPVDPAPVDPAPVDPAPVDPAPVDPAPVAETAIAPVASDISKDSLADITVTVTWGSATKITGASAIANSTLTGNGFALGAPTEGVNYTITDNGDGTATLILKKEMADVLPGGSGTLAMVPAGSEMVVTFVFDNGKELKFTYTVK